MKMAGDTRRSGIGLASADADGVIALGNHRITIFGHHTQIAWLQLEMHFLACASIEMNAFEATQSNAGSAFDGWEFEIKLDNLFSGELACIGDGHVGAYGLS